MRSGNRSRRTAFNSEVSISEAVGLPTAHSVKDHPLPAIPATCPCRGASRTAATSSAKFRRRTVGTTLRIVLFQLTNSMLSKAGSARAPAHGFFRSNSVLVGVENLPTAATTSPLSSGQSPTVVPWRAPSDRKYGRPRRRSTRRFPSRSGRGSSLCDPQLDHQLRGNYRLDHRRASRRLAFRSQQSYDAASARPPAQARAVRDDRQRGCCRPLPRAHASRARSSHGTRGHIRPASRRTRASRHSQAHRLKA